MPNNEHIVRIIACFEDSQYYYMLQEACDGGDLLDFLQLILADDIDVETLDREVRQVMGELLLALLHFHWPLLAKRGADRPR